MTGAGSKLAATWFAAVAMVGVVPAAATADEPVSDEAVLEVPAEADTKAPTEPVWVVGIDPGCQPGFQIVGLSTDDTTPQAAIRYESTALALDFGRAERYVNNFNLPVISPLGPPNLIRAVDEAGNRSREVEASGIVESCQ